MGWALAVAVSWLVVLVPAARALAYRLRREDAAIERRRLDAPPPPEAAVPPVVPDSAAHSS